MTQRQLLREQQSTMGNYNATLVVNKHNSVCSTKLYSDVQDAEGTSSRGNALLTRSLSLRRPLTLCACSVTAGHRGDQAAPTHPSCAPNLRRRILPEVMAVWIQSCRCLSVVCASKIPAFGFWTARNLEAGILHADLCMLNPARALNLRSQTVGSGKTVDCRRRS